MTQLSGRNRRLLYEWQKMEAGLQGRSDIAWNVVRTNAAGLPVSYHIDYHIRSICGVTDIEHLGGTGIVNEPIYADWFQMQIDLPFNYPSVDGKPRLQFLTCDEAGLPIPHPWHPNIRYFGDFSGRVCINMADTYTDLIWGVRRVADYLRYNIYHAALEPPYPEDLQVAAWVRRQEASGQWSFNTYNTIENEK